MWRPSKSFRKSGRCFLWHITVYENSKELLRVRQSKMYFQWAGKLRCKPWWWLSVHRRRASLSSTGQNPDQLINKCNRLCWYALGLRANSKKGICRSSFSNYLETIRKRRLVFSFGVYAQSLCISCCFCVLLFTRWWRASPQKVLETVCLVWSQTNWWKHDSRSRMVRMAKRVVVANLQAIYRHNGSFMGVVYSRFVFQPVFIISAETLLTFRIVLVFNPDRPPLPENIKPSEFAMFIGTTQEVHLQEVSARHGSRRMLFSFDCLFSSTNWSRQTEFLVCDVKIQNVPSLHSAETMGNSKYLNDNGLLSFHGIWVLEEPEAVYQTCSIRQYYSQFWRHETTSCFWGLPVWQKRAERATRWNR